MSTEQFLKKVELGSNRGYSGQCTLGSKGNWRGTNPMIKKYFFNLESISSSSFDTKIDD